MILLVLFLLPIWAVLLLDSGLKLLLLGGRLWEKPRAKKPKELLVPPHWASIGIVIPAHNEDAIIGETARLLTQLSYPSSRFTVVVLADGCTDQTASRAREQGARCIERAAQAEQGKGRALSWLLMEHAETLRDFDIVLICDADSRLHPDALSFINQAFANGCQVIQTTVEREAKASPIGAAVALPEALSQEIDDRARMRFGWSVPLRGTGMAFRRELLMQVGGSLRTRAEDLELSLRLAAAGVRVTKVSRAVVYDPKPLEAMGATRQRARWLQGHWEVVRWYWRDALQVFRAGYWGDRALLVSLLCRPRTFMIGAKMLLALAGCLWGITSSRRLSMIVGVGASVALLTDFLYYLSGFFFLSRREARGGMWRVVLYAPIWLGAVALSLFSTKKWLRVRDRVVEP